MNFIKNISKGGVGMEADKSFFGLLKAGGIRVNEWLKANGAKEWMPVLLFVLVAAFITLEPSRAFAASATGGQSFVTLYTRLEGWVSGLPGIMAAIVIMVFGIYMSFFGGKSPMFFFGSALAAAAIFLIPTIASNIAGAVW